MRRANVTAPRPKTSIASRLTEARPLRLIAVQAPATTASTITATATLKPASSHCSLRHRARRIRDSVRAVNCAGATGSTASSASSQNISEELCLVVLLEVRFEQPPKLLLRPVQLRLHRPERQLERLGQVLVLHALQIVRRDEQPIVRWKPSDGLLQPIAQLEIAELPISGRQHHPRPWDIVTNDTAQPRIVKELRRFRPPQGLRAHVRDDAVDPGGEPGFAAKIREAAVHSEEHILRQIFGLRTILNRPRHQGEHQPLVTVDELLKRPLVARPAALHERPLIGRGPGRSGPWSAVVRVHRLMY